MSLIVDIWARKTSLSPSLFIEVSVPSQESEWPYICMLWISFLSLFTVFRTVLTVCYFMFFILFIKSRHEHSRNTLIIDQSMNRQLD